MLPSEEEGRAVTCRIRVRRTGLGPPMTAFHFSRDRSMGTARAILGDCHGTVIRDGHVGYGGLPADVAGRRAHCRRRFVEARGSHPELAGRAIALIRGLHAIAAAARAELADRAIALILGLHAIAAAAGAELADRAIALIRGLCAIEAAARAEAVARAAACSPDREAELRRHLADPRLNIDSSPCGNVIRPLCLGRRNWLFVGSEGGGVSMAVLAGLAATCGENGVDFEEWMLDVLPRPDSHPAARIGELLPHEWRNRRDAPAEPAD